MADLAIPLEIPNNAPKADIEVYSVIAKTKTSNY